jgi:hypothetical protein
MDQSQVGKEAGANAMQRIAIAAIGNEQSALQAIFFQAHPSLGFNVNPIVRVLFMGTTGITRGQWNALEAAWQRTYPKYNPADPSFCQGRQTVPVDPTLELTRALETNTVVVEQRLAVVLQRQANANLAATTAALQISNPHRPLARRLRTSDV